MSEAPQGQQTEISPRRWEAIARFFIEMLWVAIWTNIGTNNSKLQYVFIYNTKSISCKSCIALTWSSTCQDIISNTLNSASLNVQYIHASVNMAFVNYHWCFQFCRRYVYYVRTYTIHITHFLLSFIACVHFCLQLFNRKTSNHNTSRMA